MSAWNPTRASQSKNDASSALLARTFSIGVGL
jgi:hypothetical protein